MRLGVKHHVFGGGNAAHVQNSVTHATKSGVDADTGGVGYFFKAHVSVVSHNQYFSLCFRKFIYQVANIFMNLFCNDQILDGLFAELFTIKDVYFLSIAALHIFGFLLTIVVYNQVVGYTRNPSGKLAMLRVSALAYSSDSFYESILKYVICYIFILYDTNDIVEDSVLMPFEQDVKSLFVTIALSFHQLFVGFAHHIYHSYSFVNVEVEFDL